MEQKERAPRVSLMLMAQICREDDPQPTLHRVGNLSSTGARITRPGDLREGDCVAVMVGQADAVPATVVWVRDDAAGLHFHWEISVEQARARRPAGSHVPVPAISAGWMNDLRNVYRR